MEVSVNHLLLQMLSNSFMLSCIRFYAEEKQKSWRDSGLAVSPNNILHHTITAVPSNYNIVL